MVYLICIGRPQRVPVKTPLHLLCLTGEFCADFKLSVQHRELQLDIVINSGIHLYLLSPLFFAPEKKQKQTNKNGNQMDSENQN